MPLSVHIIYLLALLFRLSASIRCGVFPQFFSFKRILPYQTSNSTLLHPQQIPDLSFVPAPQAAKEGWHWLCGVSLCTKHPQLCCWWMVTQLLGQRAATGAQRFGINAERIRGINLTAAPRANTWQISAWVSQLDRREINFLRNILFGITGMTIMAISASCSKAVHWAVNRKQRVRYSAPRADSKISGPQQILQLQYSLFKSLSRNWGFLPSRIAFYENTNFLSLKKKLVCKGSHPALGRISAFDSCSFHLFNNVNYSHSAMSSFH